MDGSALKATALVLLKGGFLNVLGMVCFMVVFYYRDFLVKVSGLRRAFSIIG